MTSLHTRDNQRAIAAGTQETHRYHTTPAGLLVMQTRTPYEPHKQPSVETRSYCLCTSEPYGNRGSVERGGPGPLQIRDPPAMEERYAEEQGTHALAGGHRGVRGESQSQLRRGREMGQQFRIWMFRRMVLRDETGAAAIEYGLLAALIAVAFFAGAQLLGTNLNNLFNDIGSFLGSVSPIGGS